MANIFDINRRGPLYIQYIFTRQLLPQGPFSMWRNSWRTYNRTHTEYADKGGIFETCLRVPKLWLCLLIG